MIFLRAGGQWLFEKPASLSPSLLLSLSTCLSFPTSLCRSLLSLPALQYLTLPPPRVQTQSGL